MLSEGVGLCYNMQFNDEQALCSIEQVDELIPGAVFAGCILAVGVIAMTVSATQVWRLCIWLCHICCRSEAAEVPSEVHRESSPGHRTVATQTVVTHTAAVRGRLLKFALLPPGRAGAWPDPA